MIPFGQIVTVWNRCQPLKGLGGAQVPALYKIFDEILVNAADNSKRDAKARFLGKVEAEKSMKIFVG